MVSVTRLLEVFRDARALGLHWEKLVRALGELEAVGPTDQQGRAWVKVAAKLSGYTVTQIREMQRTHAALETLHSRAKQINLPSLLHSVPYSHFEILARIAKIDPDAALTRLSSDFITTGNVTYRELRDQYHELRQKAPRQTSPIATGMRTSREFENLCLSILIKNNAEPLYLFQNASKNERHITRWPGAFRYASPNLMIETRRNTGKPQIDAADCFTVYGDILQDETIKRIPRISFEASFFKVFWIMLPTWSPVSLFESAIKTLKLNNIGVAAVDCEKRSIAHVTPPSGNPIPDRRDILHESMSMRSRLKHS